MIALLGLNNRNSLIRQLSVILMAENGKLQRLLVPSHQYVKGLYDLIYYETESIQQSIITKLTLLHPFKYGEIKSLEDMTKLITNISPYQILVDTFDHKKAGFQHDGMIRDIQTILVSELVTKWKGILESQQDSNSYS
jgi:hypothetical protein